MEYSTGAPLSSTYSLLENKDINIHGMPIIPYKPSHNPTLKCLKYYMKVLKIFPKLLFTTLSSFYQLVLNKIQFKLSTSHKDTSINFIKRESQLDLTFSDIKITFHFLILLSIPSNIQIKLFCHLDSGIKQTLRIMEETELLQIRHFLF